MRKIICMLIFTCSLELFAQGNLEKLFYKLPSAYCLDFDQDRRKAAIEEMKAINSSGMMLDEKNGYLIYGIYQCPLEMCYWSFKDKNGSNEYKIAAVKTGCVGRVIFFKEEKGEMAPFIPEPMEYFNALFFFKDETKIAEIKELADEYYMTIPQNGTTLTILYGPAYRGEIPDPELKKKDLLKGDRIDLIWENGDFKLGEPYFAK